MFGRQSVSSLALVVDPYAESDGVFLPGLVVDGFDPLSGYPGVSFSCLVLAECGECAVPGRSACGYHHRSRRLVSGAGLTARCRGAAGLDAEGG